MQRGIIKEIPRLSGELKTALVEGIADFINLGDALLQEWNLLNHDKFLARARNLSGAGMAFKLERLEKLGVELALFVENLSPSCTPPGKVRDWIGRVLDQVKALQESLGTSDQQKMSSDITEVIRIGSHVAKRVYLVESEEGKLKEEVSYLEESGYRLTSFNDISAFREAAMKKPPEVIVMDCSFLTGHDRCLEIFSGLPLGAIPVLLNLECTDALTKLNVQKLLTFEVNIVTYQADSILASIKEALGQSQKEFTSRVLIVDSCRATATFFAELLEEHGMQVLTVRDPVQVLHAAAEFKPEVVLMELHMPTYDGAMLASALRREKSTRGIPVIFLSSEKRASVQNKALLWSGELFLTKDINPESLLGIVANQVERSRASASAAGIAEVTDFDHVLDVINRDTVKSHSLVKGSTTDTYRILNHLGAGGMGTTFLAQRVKDEEQVVLKFCFSNNEKAGEIQSLFLNEARAVLDLDHPNLVKGYDFVLTPTYSFLVMEYIQGHSLSAYLHLMGRMEPIPAAKTIFQIIKALVFLEARKVSHGDIKPSNIILSQEGRTKLVDFGLATTAVKESEGITSGEVRGSPKFMAPERLAGQRQGDIRSDIYSLGITFFEILTGASPFQETTTAELLDGTVHRVPFISDLQAAVPTTLSDIVKKMTDPEPDRRYQHSWDLMVDLEKVINSLQVPAA